MTFYVFKRTLLFATVLVFALHSVSAAAIILPILTEQDGWSDMAVLGVSGSYDATTGVFKVTAGTASQFDVGPGGAADYTPFNASFRISDITNLVINSSTGNVTSNGNLRINLVNSGGVLPDPPYVVGQDLLTGNITNVAFNGTGVINMLFTVTGGTAGTSTRAGAPENNQIPYGGIGHVGGLILTMGGPGASATNFNNSFTFNTSSVDVFGEPASVPEPSSLVLVGGYVVLAGLKFGRCRRVARR